jgi:predicted short-subunit dehydrogenase-like oxidoreductase (DUF2520 family)
MRVTIIGYGNLGYSLSHILYSLGLLNAILVKKIPDKGNLPFITNLKEIPTKSDLYIFATQDKEIEKILDTNQGFFKAKTLIHCSGTLSSKIFSGFTENYGVFYPLHSFVKGTQSNFTYIPVFITASTSKTEALLKKLAEKLNSHYKLISDKERLSLHLAAVFAQNFTNHMLYISKSIAEQNNLSFSDIIKLLKPYFNKITEGISPEKLQTGPAIRNDLPTLNKHIKLLESNSDWQNIYRFVSDSIQKTYNNKNEDE